MRPHFKLAFRLNCISYNNLVQGFGHLFLSLIPFFCSSLCYICYFFSLLSLANIGNLIYLLKVFIYLLPKWLKCSKKEKKKLVAIFADPTWAYTCSFIGNRGLCGKQINVDCKDEFGSAPGGSGAPSSGSWFMALLFPVIIV